MLLSFKIKDEYHKLIETVNRNHKWFTLLTFLCIISLSLNVSNDFDIYFLVENGEFIIENGYFPTIDWISMHEDFNIILQQWVVSVIDYLVYENFSYIGLIFLVTIINLVTCICIYKLVLLKTNNSYLTSMCVALLYTMLYTTYNHSPRPMFWSVLFIVLCLLVMQVSKKNIWFLLFMPLLSLAQANFHSTFWIALAGTYIVTLFGWFISDKELFSLKKNIAIVIASTIASALISLVNPYGLKALLHPLYTIGYQGYSMVNELVAISGTSLIVYVMIPLVIYIVTVARNGLNKKAVASLILYIITLIATIFSVRCAIFELVMWVNALSDVVLIRNSTNDSKMDKKSIISLISVFLLIIFTMTSNLENTLNNWQIFNNEKDEVVEFLGEGHEGESFYSEDITVGQYLYHKNGMKPYIDGRLETYIKSLNGKEEIFDEYFDTYKSKNFDEFVEKYKFDYLILRNDSSNGNFAKTLENYKEVFNSYQEGDNPFSTYKVYERI